MLSQSIFETLTLHLPDTLGPPPQGCHAADKLFLERAHGLEGLKHPFMKRLESGRVLTQNQDGLRKSPMLRGVPAHSNLPLQRAGTGGEQGILRVGSGTWHGGSIEGGPIPGLYLWRRKPTDSCPNRLGSGPEGISVIMHPMCGRYTFTFGVGGDTSASARPHGSWSAWIPGFATASAASNGGSGGRGQPGSGNSRREGWT